MGFNSGLKGLNYGPRICLALLANYEDFSNMSASASRVETEM
jgi:hypothetical protein